MQSLPVYLVSFLLPLSVHFIPPVALTDMGPAYYFSHNDYEKVTIHYVVENTTAHPLNTEADKLIRSILAEAGIYSAYISSTKRTFREQAEIMKEVSDANLRAWYGEEAALAVRKYDVQTLEQWLKDNKPNISRHIPGYALDVIIVGGNKLDTPENNAKRNAYYAAINKLLPIKSFGIHYYLRENNGVEHTEFTFQVTNTID